MVWTNPTWSLGFVVALGVLLVTVILSFMKLIDLPTALLICAVSAVRL